VAEFEKEFRQKKIFRFCPKLKQISNFVMNLASSAGNSCFPLPNPKYILTFLPENN
jgi:hypothetical protein